MFWEGVLGSAGAKECVSDRVKAGEEEEEKRGRDSEQCSKTGMAADPTDFFMK